jgi:hypothetical protein
MKNYHPCKVKSEMNTATIFRRCGNQGTFCAKISAGDLAAVLAELD